MWNKSSLNSRFSFIPRRWSSLSSGQSRVSSLQGPQQEETKLHPPLFIASVTFFESFLFVFVVIASDGLKSYEENSMIGPSTAVMYRFGGLNLSNNQYWRLFTSMCLHAGVLHLLPNMVIQWWVGKAIEATWNYMWTFILYVLSGLGGALLTSTLSKPDQLSVGSSGAVYGLLAAAAVGNTSQLKWPVVSRLVESTPLEQFTAAVTWKVLFLAILLSLAAGLIMPGIDNWSHAGGALTGLAIAAGRLRQKRKSGKIEFIARICAIMLGIAMFSACACLLWCNNCFEPPGQMAQVLV